MNKPTFKEQSEKIIQAYLKCEIQPFNPCACFVGNLLNNTGDWIDGRSMLGMVKPDETFVRKSISEESNGLYTLEEILELEKNFMEIVTVDYFLPNKQVCEDAIFEAMVSTLEMLKQIHISKGEIIEEEVTLEKRVLC